MKKMKRIFLMLSIFMIFVVINYILIIGQYKKAAANGGYSNWTMMQHPLYNASHKIEFLMDEAKELELNLWWRSLTGSIEVTITDKKGEIYFSKKANQMKDEYLVALRQGRYILSINISNFTGAAALGYENIVRINAFPNEGYSIIPSDPSKSFYWDYLLYIPSKIKESKLLVVPNNTGKVSDLIDVHKEKAKELIIYKATLAEDLGIPLLVPIFPRPESHNELYTHALDRETIFTNINELKRLDLQLIAMIDDAKRILSEKGIMIDEKIFMSGFSASGDFVDRFTFLHPEMVKAAVIGGSDNIIPYKNLNGENIPYPIGIYDYEKITGREFDVNLIGDVYRYIFKGAEDEGGWQLWVENGKKIRCTGKEYYEKFEAPQLIESLKKRAIPICVEGNLTDVEQKEILFRAYDGKILIDRFLKIKETFDTLNIDKSEFVVYKGIGHEITEEIRQDELEFFRKILNKP